MPSPLESSVFAQIGDHSVDGPNAKAVNLRIPETMYAYLAALANENGRSVSEEIRASLRVTIELSRLSVIANPDLQKERQEASGGILGLKPETAQRVADQIRESVAEEWAQTFPRSARAFSRDFPGYLWQSKPAA